jgi:antibiotic biosynthesis monooxygenase (ABM) superfamily enzyme
MYGTVARFQLKPGVEQRFMDEQMKAYEGANVDGYIGTIVYRLDSGGDDYYMAVIFRDKESYFANADSPEQNARYEGFRALLQDDPKWHDGEIAYIFNAQTGRG